MSHLTSYTLILFALGQSQGWATTDLEKETKPDNHSNSARPGATAEKQDYTELKPVFEKPPAATRDLEYEPVVKNVFSKPAGKKVQTYFTVDHGNLCTKQETVKPYTVPSTNEGKTTYTVTVRVEKAPVTSRCPSKIESLPYGISLPGAQSTVEITNPSSHSSSDAKKDRR